MNNRDLGQAVNKFTNWHIHNPAILDAQPDTNRYSYVEGVLKKVVWEDLNQDELKKMLHSVGDPDLWPKSAAFILTICALRDMGFTASELWDISNNKGYEEEDRKLLRKQLDNFKPELKEGLATAPALIGIGNDYATYMISRFC